jgi:predicted ester cyclase
MTTTAIESGTALLRSLIEDVWASIAGMDSMAKKVAPDYVHHTMQGDLDFDGFRRGFAGIRTAFPDSRYVIHHVFGDGEMFGAMVTLTAEHRGPFGPIGATGKVLTSHGAYHCRIVDGLIVEDWETWAALGIPRQLGILMQG